MTDDIGFKVIASVDGLKSTMTEATVSVTKFTAESKAQIAVLSEAFETLNKVMLGFAAVLAGGFIFKEIIEGTEKWTDSVRTLSHQFGLTTEEASGLAASLKLIGSSSEEYAASALKLDRQVKSNEDKVNELGVVTRATNGDLLSQQQIMLNAISTLNSYKEGTDRNVASQYLFGRGAGDLQKLLRLNSEALKQGTDDAQRFGLVVDNEASEAGRKFQRTIAELNLAMLGMQRELGDKIIPALTDLAVVFTEKIIPAIGKGIDAIRDFLNAFGQVYALVASAHDPDVRAALDDEVSDRANGVKNTGKSGPEKLPAGGTKTVPEGFGTDNGAAAASKQKIQLAELEVSKTEELGKIELQNKKNVLDAGVAAGTISKQQELEQLRQLADEEYKIDLTALETQEKIGGLSVVQKKKIDDQIEVLHAKHNAALSKLDLETVKAQESIWKGYATTVTNAMNQMLTGILQGTQTWQQGMSRLFSNLAISFIEKSVDKMVNSWLVGEGIKTTATNVGNAERTASNVGASTAGLAAQAAGAQSSIGMSAGQAAASVYADVAAIPYVGWLLAPPAAAAAFVAVEAFGGGFSAAGGFDIPAGVNPVTQLHQREMVLPAELADRVRGMTGGGDSGGDTHLHVHAVDADSVRRLFMDNGDHLAAALKKQMRNANPNIVNMKV